MPLLVKKHFVSFPSGVIPAIFFASEALRLGSVQRTGMLQPVNLRMKSRIHEIVAMPHADRNKHSRFASTIWSAVMFDCRRAEKVIELLNKTDTHDLRPDRCGPLTSA